MIIGLDLGSRRLGVVIAHDALPLRAVVAVTVIVDRFGATMRTRPHLTAIDMPDFTEDARMALLLGSFGTRSRKSTLPSDLDGIMRVYVAPEPASHAPPPEPRDPWLDAPLTPDERAAFDAADDPGNAYPWE